MSTLAVLRAYPSFGKYGITARSRGFSSDIEIESLFCSDKMIQSKSQNEWKKRTFNNIDLDNPIHS